jgi:hypothetical protein
MPPDFPWIVAALVLAAIGWSVPKALTIIKRAMAWSARLFAEAAAVAIVAHLEDRLAPSWLADFDEALEPIYQDINAIRLELTSNGGSSLKDKLDTAALSIGQIQKDIEPLLTEYRGRFDPPSSKGQ